MKKVIVIGGGFSGLSALSVLAKNKDLLEVTLIDKKPTFDFLPAVPDIIGQKIDPKFLTYSLADFSKKNKINFVNSQVNSVSLSEKNIITDQGSFFYDYLIIAAGAKTNFYGNQEIEEQAYTLDQVSQGSKIRNALLENDYSNFILSGAGYTGIEVASNLRRFFKKRGIDKNIIIVEKSDSILGPLPFWMKKYVSSQLEKINIKVISNESIQKISGREIFLSNQKRFENSLCIWAAGVTTADFIASLDVEKDRQKRIVVDEFLRVDKNCFVTGDAASFKTSQGVLRMGVQFSLTQGQLAAKNIVRDLKGFSLKKFRPIDLGYVVPIANNRGCGKAVGLPIKGLAPIILHYFFCIYRNPGLENKFGVFKNLFFQKPKC